MPLFAVDTDEQYPWYTVTPIVNREQANQWETVIELTDDEYSRYAKAINEYLNCKKMIADKLRGISDV